MQTFLSYPASRTSCKALTCAGLVALADFLFYNPYHLGWVLGLFVGAVLAAVIIYNPLTLRDLPGKLLAGLTLLLVFSIIETPNMLNIMLSLICLMGLALRHGTLLQQDTLRWLRLLSTYCIRGWVRIVADGSRWTVLKNRYRKQGITASLVTMLLLPICFTLVFILLFSQANPVIGQWMGTFGWQGILGLFSPLRWMFWLVMAAACWAFIRPRTKRWYSVEAMPKYRTTLTDVFFNPRSVTLSLVVFNLLFFFQNILDVAFLWRGLALPEGLTHAEYAHQGAYPLVATALLAAVFVLVALRPVKTTGDSPFIRHLIYLWVGQNIFLVGSAASRLMNYIGDYSLTYLRVAAFIWMGLVACGLLLIIARIYWNKTGKWLVNANLSLLFCVLYVCSFINFGSMIGYYNVQHCKEVTGKGSYLDTWYFYELGPASLPALRWFYAHAAYSPNVYNAILSLEHRLDTNRQNWRSWTYRNARVAKEVAGDGYNGKVRR